jgi:hypothetical protein
MGRQQRDQQQIVHLLMRVECPQAFDSAAYCVFLVDHRRRIHQPSSPCLSVST